MRPCLQPRCPNLVGKGVTRCPEHDPGPWGNRPNFVSRYGMRRAQWERLRRRVLRRDRHRCVRCGATHSLEVDHIVPRAQGGTNDEANLQTLCSDCHASKTQDDRKAQPR